MYGLTNKYLLQLMKTKSVSFKGVFSSNNIPFFHEHDVSFICNFSRLYEEGSHYIAIYITSKKILYFDPFGLECLVDDICNYLSLYNKQIIHSSKIIQHPLSFHCGYFCAGFIFAMEFKLKMKDYQEFFNDNNLMENDRIIRDIMSFILRKLT